MENIKEKFETAVKEVDLLKERPSNETLLQLYSLFKQASEGDNTKDVPENPFDFVAKAKYDAWLALKGKSIDDAMIEYIELFEKLRN